MTNSIKDNPYTSLVGLLLSTLLGFVLFAPQYFPPLALDIAKYISLGGALGLGLSARDPNKG